MRTQVRIVDYVVRKKVAELVQDGVTLILEGDVSLEELSRAAAALEMIVNGLAESSDPDAIVEWFADVDKGSLVVIARGRSDTTSGKRVVSNIYKGWEETAEDARSNRIDRYPQTVRRGFSELTSMISNRLPSMRFRRENKKEDEGVRITAPVEPETLPPPGLVAPSIVKKQAFGALRGLVTKLSREQHLTITLRISGWSSAVVCHLPSRLRTSMRDYFDQYVTVYGIISREGGTGRPVSIGQVERVDVIPRSEGSIKDAEGCVPRSDKLGLCDSSEDWWDG